MTSIEYAYTERDIYQAIVHTAVPIALTADETALLVAECLKLSQELRDEDPAGVFFILRKRVLDPDYNRMVGAISPWRLYARRLSAFARQAAEYPSLK